MTFLHSNQNLKTALGQDERVYQEYLLMNPSNPSQKQGIFSYNNLMKSDLINGMISLSKEHLIRIISQKMPYEDVFKDTIQLIAPKGQKIIKYKKKSYEVILKLKGCQNMEIFSQKTISYFLISRDFLNVEAFSNFGLGLLSIQKEFVQLLHDSSRGDGILSESDIDVYIDIKLRSDSALSDIIASKAQNYEFYRSYIVVRLMQSMDPLSRNKLNAHDLVSSREFALFLDRDSSKTNPYSYSAFATLYSIYFQIARTEGTISKSDLRCFNSVDFSASFISRVFDEVTLYNGCMDFTSFVRFDFLYNTLSNENSARFFFRVLDVDSDGIIGPSDILFFFKDLSKENPDSHVSFDVFLQELLDKTMSHSLGISFQHFYSSRCAEEIVRLLAEPAEFKIYTGVSHSKVDGY